MSGPMHTVYEGSEGRMLVTDSCTYCDERVRTTDVIIAGSFAGEIAAAMALRRGARAFLGNAAGIGRDGAGMSGLTLAQRLGAPAAALSEQSARLGDGPDGYTHGVIARINALAHALNDAGVGKDQSGIAGLALLNQVGIPAASVAAMSACIGSGTSTYEHGIISHCNAVAQARGVRQG